MVTHEPRIEVVIGTFRRPHVLRRPDSLAAQALPADVSIGVAVADDDRLSTREAVEGVAHRSPHPLTYVQAPARNISVARNAGIAYEPAGAAERRTCSLDLRIDGRDPVRIVGCVSETHDHAVPRPRPA